MSSHREAPGISKDPVADSTDVYGFVSPDRPDTVTLIANYIPLESPAGGPNFFEFGDDVLYEIHVDNDGDAQANVTYQFRFTTEVRNPDTFLYNTGQVLSLDDPHWNRRQFYSVTRVNGSDSQVLAEGLTCPPCNVGPRSMPNYSALAEASVHRLDGGIRVFAGQRREGFYVDLGSVFDLLDLRPFQHLHLIPTSDAKGVDSLAEVNVHTIAIQVPKSALTRDGSNPTDLTNPKSTVGIWSSASRARAHMHHSDGETEDVGPWIQVSRLGNPLINEAVIPMGKKDYWNAQQPKDDAQFLKYVQHPEVAALLPILYPGVFPHLAALTAPRADLAAILMTGVPGGLVPGFQNLTGSTPADMLRLNMAIPPTTSNPNNLGVIAGDNAGFPNGRRVADDVFTIELRCIAGLLYSLIDHNFVADGAAGAVTDIVNPSLSHRYISHFPYLGVPLDGFNVAE